MRWGPPAISSPVTKNRARGKRVTSSRSRAERSTRGNVIYNPGPDTFTVTSTSDGMVSSMDNCRSEELGAGLQMGAALRNALDEQTQWRHSGFQQRGSLGVTMKPQEGTPQPQAQNHMTSSFGITSFRLGKPCLFRTSQPTINWYLSALPTTENILADSY